MRTATDHDHDAQTMQFIEAFDAPDWEGAPHERAAAALFDVAEVSPAYGVDHIALTLQTARVSLRMIERDRPEQAMRAHTALQNVERAMDDAEPVELVAAVCRLHVGPVWRALVSDTRPSL